MTSDFISISTYGAYPDAGESPTAAVRAYYAGTYGLLDSLTSGLPTGEISIAWASKKSGLAYTGKKSGIAYSGKKGGITYS